MKKSEIKVGGLYLAKVSGQVTTVRVDAIRERPGRLKDGTSYDVTNLKTGRKTTFQSATKFRSESQPQYHDCKGGCGRRDLEALKPWTCLLCGQRAQKAAQKKQEGCEAGPFAPPAQDHASIEAGHDLDVRTPDSELSKYELEDVPEEVERNKARADFDKRVQEAIETSEEVSEESPFDSADGQSCEVVPTGDTILHPSLAAADVPAAGHTVASLASQIAANLPKSGCTIAGMTPNEEQEVILELIQRMFASRGTMVTCAGAGAGKTALLRMIEQVLRGCGQYTAFNKSIVEDSRSKFVRAAVNTTHSLAFRAVGHRYAHRLDSERMRSGQVAAILGIKSMTIILKGQGPPSMKQCPLWTEEDDHTECTTCGGMGTVSTPTDKIKILSAEFLAGQVQVAVRRFCQSADPCITTRHFGYIHNIDNPIDPAILADMMEDAASGDRDAISALRETQNGTQGRDGNDRVMEYLLPFARAMWDDLSSVEGRLPFNADCYVKVWQLGTGDDRPVIGADYILLDEAQDTAPVFLDIIRQQTHALVVLVGDDNQQIYEWRGAVNAMSTFPDAPRRLLTQSYRFGQAIADAANAVLGELDEPTDLVMRGLPIIPSRVCVVQEPRCYLYRTNAAAIGRIMNSVADGKHPHLIGNATETVRWCKAALDLQSRPPRKTTHPELACFDTWEEVQVYSKSDEGGDLRLMVKLTDEFGAQEIMDALQGMPSEEDADLVVSTAHKSKGREWESVKLGGDFPTANKMSDADRRLLYVAVTRAKMNLDISECPPFCGGTEKVNRGFGLENVFIPGIEIHYTQEMPTEEEQAEYLRAKDSRPAAKPPSPLSTASGIGPGVIPTRPAGTPPASPQGRESAIASTAPVPPANGGACGFTWSSYTDSEGNRSWKVRGPANMEGQRVKVTRKDGSFSMVSLGERLAEYGGVWIYEV